MYICMYIRVLMLSMQIAKVIKISPVSSLFCELSYCDTKDLLEKNLMIEIVDDAVKLPR